MGIDEIKARNYNLDFKNPHTVADDHGNPAELLAKLEQDEQKADSLRDQLKSILVEALLRSITYQTAPNFESRAKTNTNPNKYSY